MKSLAIGFYIVVAVISFGFMWYAITTPPPVRHNVCTIAEISPDITPEERKRCREIRGHKL